MSWLRLFACALALQPLVLSACGDAGDKDPTPLDEAPADAGANPRGVALYLREVCGPK